MVDSTQYFTHLMKLFKKCIYEAAIILVRNPFHALVAEFNRQMTSKTGFVDPEYFSSMGWDDFISEYRNDRQINFFKWSKYRFSRK